MEKLGINLYWLIAQFLAFLVLMLAMRALAYKPLAKILEERRKKIEKGLEDAKAAAQARAEAEQEKEKILAEARQEARKIIAEAAEVAKARKEEILAEAEQQAQNIVREAEEVATKEKEKLLAQSRNEIIALAMAAAQRLVEVSLDEKRQKEIITAFFTGIEEGKVPIVEQAPLARVKEVVVTSALPLTEEEKAAYVKALQSRLGKVKVVFKTEPSILGGVVLKVGDFIVDDSMMGKLQKLRKAVAA